MVNTLHQEVFGVHRLITASSFYERKMCKTKKDGLARPFLCLMEHLIHGLQYGQQHYKQH